MWQISLWQTFCKCTFLIFTECTSCRAYRDSTEISTELLCNLYSNMSAFCACFSEQVVVPFPHSGRSRPSPWEPSSSSEDSLSGTRARSSWPSTLTLLDSIMPVLAWNLTVFNLARSFFSTLLKKTNKQKTKGMTLSLGMNGNRNTLSVWHEYSAVNDKRLPYLFLLGMTPICSLSPCGVTSLACHHSSSEALMTWRISP